QAEEKERAERAARIEREITRRREGIRDEESLLDQERDQLQGKWRERIQRIPPPVPSPVDATVEAVREARAGWQRATDEVARRRAFAQEWADKLRAEPEFLAGELRARANVVAAPLSGLAADARFGTFSVPQDQAFDLLLVEHAEQVTEAEFTALAGRCRRWVLIAESMPGPRVLAASIGDTTEASRDRPKTERRKVKPAAPSFFQKLWSRLHCDPSRLPYAWSRESDAR